jgi:hypothetical protein
MLSGYYITKAITRNKAQSLAVGIEVGIVNGTLGIAIAAGILENSVMTIPAAIYSIIMFPGAMLLVYLGNKKEKEFAAICFKLFLICGRSKSVLTNHKSFCTVFVHIFVQNIELWLLQTFQNSERISNLILIKFPKISKL